MIDLEKEHVIAQMIDNKISVHIIVIIKSMNFHCIYAGLTYFQRYEGLERPIHFTEKNELNYFYLF